MKRLCGALLAVLLGLPGLGFAQVTLTHVHGLAYSPDGKRLMLPSHHGLAIYERGKWSKAPGPQHDYMGFSATSSAIYSSGHPEHGSNLVNPFGLLRSRDGGKTWDKLGLEGESDFHVMAASWSANTVYVWNPAPNSRMKQAGLHFTLNDGFSWKRAGAAGLQGDARAIAVHPVDGATVAVASTAGLYLSRDAGERFLKVAGNREALAAFMDLEGKHVWFSYFDGQPRLGRVPLDGGNLLMVATPPLKEDAVAYIAQNPAQRGEFAIATFQRDVYVSKDSGQTWTRIANRGNTRSFRGI